jgi:hypothetical protein
MRLGPLPPRHGSPPGTVAIAFEIGGFAVRPHGQSDLAVTRGFPVVFCRK